MLSFAVTRRGEGAAGRGNMKTHFTSLCLRPGLDIMKRGNGSAALCSVSN